MTLEHLPLLRHAILLCAALAASAPFTAAGQRAAPLPPDPCLRLQPGASAAVEALGRLRFTRDGEAREIRDVRFTGLRSLSEESLWRLIGRRGEGALTAEQAGVIIARVAETGLFEHVEPRLHLDADGAYLELVVDELPRLERVVITGLTEVRDQDVLDALLRTPRPGRASDRGRDGDDGDDDDDDDDGADADGGRSGDVRWRSDAYRCPAPVPPRALFARPREGGVIPGIVWRGLSAGLERVVRSLQDDGYLMATLRARLSLDGTLTLEIDEGRLEAVELVGVPPDVEREVREELGLEAGEVFVLADVENAMRRVERRFPFLEKGVASSGRPRPARIVEREGDNGGRLYTLEEVSASQADVRLRERRITITVNDREGRSASNEFDLGALPEGFFGEERDFVSIEGRRAKVYFDENRTSFDTDWIELLRHTPVTGYSPGLGVSGWLYDPRDRIHLGVDASLHLNTGRPGQPVDYVVGPKVQLPSLSLAELGAQIYARTDSPDVWRVGQLDSWLHSLIVNQPNADYHRRTGFAAFATFHVLRQLTLGAEYRLDQHASMDTVTGNAWFGRIPPHDNPAVDEGRMGSLIGRIEWSTERVNLDRVGGRLRAPELSLVDRDWYDELEQGFAAFATVEVADPSLGGAFRFVRVVTDGSMHVRTGHDQGLRARLRVAGGQNLPAQKREALGGWNALRGYGFKEFEGDLSVLAMAEYHYGFVSAFADAGTVRQPDGWLSPKVGVGAALNFGPHVQVAAAWRTDASARLLPEFKAVLNRTF